MVRSGWPSRCAPGRRGVADYVSMPMASRLRCRGRSGSPRGRRSAWSSNPGRTCAARWSPDSRFLRARFGCGWWIARDRGGPALRGAQRRRWFAPSRVLGYRSRPGSLRPILVVHRPALLCEAPPIAIPATGFAGQVFIDLDAAVKVSGFTVRASDGSTPDPVIVGTTLDGQRIFEHADELDLIMLDGWVDGQISIWAPGYQTLRARPSEGTTWTLEASGADEDHSWSVPGKDGRGCRCGPRLDLSGARHRRGSSRRTLDAGEWGRGPRARFGALPLRTLDRPGRGVQFVPCAAFCVPERDLPGSYAVTLEPHR